MRTYSKLILAALAASALLAIATSGASARSFTTNETSFELIWNEGIGAAKTKFRIVAGGRTVACKVTLLGRFVERTYKKETAITQRLITHGELEACAGGTATIRNETMPWPTSYKSFTGTLPLVRSISIGIIRATFRTRETGGLECEFASEVSRPAVMIVGNSAEAGETGFEMSAQPEDITAEPNNQIALRREGFLCAFAGEARLSGIGLIRRLERTAKVAITLV